MRCALHKYTRTLVLFFNTQVPLRSCYTASEVECHILSSRFERDEAGEEMLLEECVSAIGCNWFLLFSFHFYLIVTVMTMSL